MEDREKVGNDELKFWGECVVENCTFRYVTGDWSRTWSVSERSYLTTPGVFNFGYRLLPDGDTPPPLPVGGDDCPPPDVIVNGG